MRYEYAIKLLKKLNANGVKYKLIKNCSTCYDVALVEELVEDVKPKKRNKKNEEEKKKEPSITVDSDSNDNSNILSTPSPEDL